MPLKLSDASKETPTLVRWANQLEEKVNTLSTAVNSPTAGQAPPSSSKAPGQPGDLAYDHKFLYVCLGNNQWKRLALSTF